MKKPRVHKQGFTLVEVLISLSVLIMVVVSATALLVSAITTNADNMDMIVAYGLAQEGVESVRNIRDSNWLLGSGFKKGGVINDERIWGDTLPGPSTPGPSTPGPSTPISAPALANTKKYYTIDYNNPDSSFEGLKSNLATVGEKISSSDAPWTLAGLKYGTYGCSTVSPELQFSCAQETLLYKKAINQNKNVYEYTVKAEDGAEATKYHRFVSVELINHVIKRSTLPDTQLLGLTYLVTSHVAWDEMGRNREVVLTTELTDWKEI